ncbi:MAG TPA: phosphate signaling complex protein PhoU [Acidimicrobiales bacterium]|nr:phosphate signaling complex protein PhoU [Acidimicrobiales bacterium]
MEIRKAFHEEMGEIRSDVIRLGALTGESIQAGTNALLDEDLATVEAIIEADLEVDALTHSIEQRTCLLLAQQQPMAVDLRVLVSILRIIHELERIGDLMVKVAKAGRRLYPEPLEPRARGLINRMRDQAEAQLRLAVDAFADGDVSKARALADMDDVMDDLQKELFQYIFSQHAAGESVLQRSVSVALVGRYYERIGDHAANFADRVEFMVTGHFAFEATEDAQGTVTETR